MCSMSIQCTNYKIHALFFHILTKYSNMFLSTDYQNTDPLQSRWTMDLPAPIINKSNFNKWISILTNPPPQKKNWMKENFMLTTLILLMCIHKYLLHMQPKHHSADLSNCIHSCHRLPTAQRKTHKKLVWKSNTQQNDERYNKYYSLTQMPFTECFNKVICIQTTETRGNEWEGTLFYCIFTKTQSEDGCNRYNLQKW